VYLVEGMRLEDPLVGCADKDLQSQRFVLHVAVELGWGKQNHSHSACEGSSLTTKKDQRGLQAAKECDRAAWSR
jgi:hypothetical protein